jgi:hypothetical protein
MVAWLLNIDGSLAEIDIDEHAAARGRVVPPSEEQEGGGSSG